MRRLFVLATLFVAVSLRADIFVSTDWLQDHLNDRGLVIVEIGDRTTFEKAHIPGARFLALHDIAVTRGGLENEVPDVVTLEKVLSAAGLTARGRVVVYARDILHAARGFVTLDYAGCGTTLSLLDGGFAKWEGEKRATETGPPAARAASFVACPRPEVLVNIGAMRKLLDEGAVAIVDARPSESFEKGHLDRAVNIPWSENLTGGATPVFRTFDDLRALYGEEREPVVVYCRTGMQASLDYVVLRALGRQVHLYDGGWSEWSPTPPPPPKPGAGALPGTADPSAG